MNGRVDLSYSAYPGRAFTYRVHQSGHGRAYGSAQDPQKAQCRFTGRSRAACLKGRVEAMASVMMRRLCSGELQEADSSA
jgi:hypothetical protein